MGCYIFLNNGTTETCGSEGGVLAIVLHWFMLRVLRFSPVSTQSDTNYWKKALMVSEFVGWTTASFCLPSEEAEKSSWSSSLILMTTGQANTEASKDDKIRLQ